MKGNPVLLDKLNVLLASEFAAVAQYMAHEGKALNWGYGELAAVLHEHLEDERKHAAALISRILFLGGAPVVDKLDPPVAIGAAVDGMIANDLRAETAAVTAYNTGIALAVSVGP